MLVAHPLDVDVEPHAVGEHVAQGRERVGEAHRARMLEILRRVSDQQFVAARQDVELDHVPIRALQPRRQPVEVAPGLDDAVPHSATPWLPGGHRGLNPTPV